jgi:hypothetical protein
MDASDGARIADLPPRHAEFIGRSGDATFHHATANVCDLGRQGLPCRPKRIIEFDNLDVGAPTSAGTAVGVARGDRLADRTRHSVTVGHHRFEGLSAVAGRSFETPPVPKNPPRGRTNDAIKEGVEGT